jgi:undecaprenyl-diphosphatase
MSDWLAAVILGLIEGLTEFIPVSSTGHLILAKLALGLSAQWDTFIVVIQLGAILAVVAVYFQRLLKVLFGLPSDPAARKFAISVLIAFLPAVVIGAALHGLIKAAFENPSIICWALIVGGVVLLVIDRWSPKPRHFDAMKYPVLMSLGIGFFQCLAMIPGVSRSGATIVGAMLLGAEKKSAAEFSFFLAIPTMAGAFAFDLYKARHDLNMDQAGLIAIGFVVAFFSGLLVVKTMINFVGKHGFAPFAAWRIVVGLAGLWLVRRAAG